MLLNAAAVLLFLAAWIVILVTNRLQSNQKLVWLAGTMFLPVIGPLIFFFKFASLRKANS
ncbi:Phospholipase_D-nuclease N-terminal [Pontibacter akesuensis]|uniref:Phospholipase_D-nuclease N-terminal n=2 Tax=Pontibacter akesuensis TaxID=388950 RepID=A0A1I7JJB0_9BACT|nr:Phospholipase_D-nuclease N-terminal [Pontibacter akesuensis]